MRVNSFPIQQARRFHLALVLVVIVMALSTVPRLGAENFKVNVNVDTIKAKSFMSPIAVGVQTDISDADFITAETAKSVRPGGITALRYPGGAVSSVYHWSRNTQTNWHGTGKTNFWIPQANHFANFIELLNQTGAQAIISEY